MSDDVQTACRLYPKLLGAAWVALDSGVRRVHLLDSPAQAAGHFQVRRAPGRLMGLALDLARVPRASDATPVELAISNGTGRRGPVERWRRVFGGHPLETLQAAAPGGLLAERIGLLEFRFQLAVEDGALIFDQAACVLRLGRLRMPLPGWLAPRIWARESVAAGLNRTSVTVTVSAPTGGLLFSYQGTVHWGRI